MLLFGIIYINKNSSKNKIYQVKNKTYYEVTLNPNSYFFTDKLEANNYYIGGAIKSVDIYFDYYLKTKTKANINYTYDIIATIKSYADNGTKLVWTKDFNLKNVDNQKNKAIKIKENYQLDYQYYVNYVKDFQAYYNIKTENYLDVRLAVKINNQDVSSVLLTIPISDNIIEITSKEDNSFSENDKQNIALEKIIVFIILVIATLYLGYKILTNKNKEKTILKSYHDSIIPIQNKPNINTSNIIYLTSLKDLIRIAENNNCNIFNYQNNYYTIIDNLYYIYNLKK